MRAVRGILPRTPSELENSQVHGSAGSLPFNVQCSHHLVKKEPRPKTLENRNSVLLLTSQFFFNAAQNPVKTNSQPSPQIGSMIFRRQRTLPLMKSLFQTVLLAAILATLFGVEPAEAQQRFPTWKATLPKGEFVVRLDRITSVSWHEYAVDGALQVTEMTVAFDGPVAARFYYAEPRLPSAPGGVGDSALNIIQDRANQALDRVGDKQADLIRSEVVKSYPTTTHARTVEYRLPDVESLKAAYESARDAWLKNKTGEYKVE